MLREVGAGHGPRWGFAQGNDREKEPTAGKAGDREATLGSAAAGGLGALLGHRGPRQGCPASALQETLSEAGEGGPPRSSLCPPPSSCRCRSGAHGAQRS